MHLKHLYLSNFKNYTEAELDFCPRINCFVGNNGSGKTNLLDAIHYLSFSKSYFGAADRDNIRHGQDYFALSGLYEMGDTEAQVNLVQKRGQRKSLKFNQKEYERMSQHVGRIPLIMVSPQDQEMVYGGSELRRKFLDTVISQFNHPYLEHLILYNKALEQRNRLLKQDNIDLSLLEVFDFQLCQHGEPLYEERRKFVESFIPVFQRYYREIAGQGEEASLGYRSSLSEKSMEDCLRESAQRDRILQYTSSGPHKDDLDLLLDAYPVRRCGSQGQQKSYLLALRLAQMQYISDIRSEFPILLLDDIFDKLDKERVGRLMDLVGQDNFGQVFLSDTHHTRVQELFAHKPVEHRIFFIREAMPEQIE